MKTQLHLDKAIAALSLLVTALTLPSSASAQNPPTRFDVNDVSFLFPVPQDKTSAESGISVDEKLLDGTDIWPEDAFKQVMDAAKATNIRTSGGRSTRMQVSDPEMFAKRGMWKVAGIRVHPSALGVSDKAITKFGEAPTVRLIVQPVSIRGESVEVHDVAAHLVFNYVLNPPNTQFVPDRVRFGALVEDLKKLKALGGIGAAKLSVHPGLSGNVAGFREGLVNLLKKHLTGDRLSTISFMGIDDPEPWIFFPMRKEGGVFVQGDVKGGFLPPTKAQMFGLRAGPGQVVPVPQLNAATGAGLSTAVLFKSGALSTLDLPLFPGATNAELSALKVRDVADRIANPAFHDNFNTDCVSCHTETTLRRRLPLAPVSPAVVYQQPVGISGVDPGVLPKGIWNVRNFGWGLEGGEFKATVAQRTANEAADSAAFINKIYLTQAAGQPAPAGPTDALAAARAVATGPVATPLTLIMDIKSPEDFKALKELLAKIESAPPAQNKIRAAMDKLGLVHFARFVFLGEDKLAVITTFDGDFDSYIGAFTREIGDIFNALLSHMKDAPPLPVQTNQAAFLKYVEAHDAEVTSFYSAYPQLTTQDILSLQPKPVEGTSPK
jgi:hypothetical protein